MKTSELIEKLQDKDCFEEVNFVSLYHPKNLKMKQKMNTTDIQYVRSVLAEKIASNVEDGKLEPPAGASCKTRSGFRAWLKRAEKFKGEK